MKGGVTQKSEPWGDGRQGSETAHVLFLRDQQTGLEEVSRKWEGKEEGHMAVGNPLVAGVLSI